MNINLKPSAASKKKGTISYGLNRRGSLPKKKNSKSIFQDDDDEAEGDETSGIRPPDARSAFNQELAAEQEAIRLRSQQTMTGDANVYDYDAEYESFSSGHQAKSAHETTISSGQSKQTNEKRESRYIQNLLKKAKERKVEREIILERKIAREQEQEEKNHEYMGKDKFVTKNYKKKLEEREEWIRKEEFRKRKEEEEDVTKKDAGSVMIGFYGNLSRIGTGTPSKEDVELQNGNSREEFPSTDSNTIHASGSTSNNYLGSDQKHQSNTEVFDHNDDDDDDDKVEDVELESELTNQQMRIKRFQKIFLARERYLRRKADREISQTPPIELQ
jgi:coiled-coil domain-containing protein 55